MTSAVGYLRAEVLGAARLTPNLVRVRLGGAGLRAFRGSGLADERVRIAFPHPGQTAPPAPVLSGGRLDYPDEAASPPVRSYTVRRIDPARAELTVDFAIHDGGVATAWAQRARPGDVVYLEGGHSWYRPPADAAWFLLLADLPGLPALSRIVDELPDGISVCAVTEVIDPRDTGALPRHDRVDYRHHHGSGHGLAASVLPQAARAFTPPDGPGYVWAACEASAARAIRQHARHVWGLPGARVDVIGYWRTDGERWMRRYRAAEAEVNALVQQAIDAGKPDDEVLDVFERALQQHGL